MLSLGGGGVLLATCCLLKTEADWLVLFGEVLDSCKWHQVQQAGPEELSCFHRSTAVCITVWR